MRRRLVLVPMIVALAVVLVAGACERRSLDPGQAGLVTGRPVEAAVALRLASRLRPFDGCGALLDHVRAQASTSAAAFGMAAAKGRFFMTDELAAVAAPAPQASTGAAAAPAQRNGGGAPPAFSGTNVAEAGVDEPDTVKTDGERIFAVARGRLQALEVTEGRPRLAGSLLLPGSGPHDLLLAGDRLLVRSSQWDAEPLVSRRSLAAGTAVPGGERTVLTLVDVSDLARPRVVSTLEVDGRVLGARMVGDVARVVTAAGPTGFAPVFPQGPTPADASQAADANRLQIEASTLENWLPAFRLDGAGAGNGGTAASGLLVDCDRVSRPAEFSGLGTVSVLTFDLSEDLGTGDATSVLADGETVYASAEALYVATNRFAGIGDGIDLQRPAASEMTTEIHKFDITGDGPARHVASGRVRGRLLNQFSMSEHDGRLRVATTDGFAGGPGSGPASESLVTVLADGGGGDLTAVGEVGNLGRGEQIYAVRFLGEVGYVVTFRQTDPLYTIDLSDPARPRVVGELKIPGYSAYLHPLGDGLLLGVGQDATDEGRRTGAQVSLFDVSDPARPQRLDQAPLGQGAAAAEFDHHAFLWWGPRSLAVLPVQSYESVPFSGAVGLSVDRADGIAEVGRVSHGASDPQAGQGFAPPPEFAGSPVSRSLIVGETLFTVSEDGILASSAERLSPLSWVAF